MMKTVALLAVLLVPGLAWGEEEKAGKAGSTFPGPVSDAPNEAEIRQRFDEFTVAWNRHDAKALADMWAVDGDHLEPDGRVAKGRAEVEKLLGMEHSTVFKNTKIELSIDTVWFITADVALADGRYTLSGATDPKGAALHPLQGHLTAIMMRERDRWWVAGTRLMRPVPLEWRPEK